MPVKMPGAVPTRTDDSIGRVKRDRARVPNRTDYVPADEWNNLCDELIETATLAKSLAATGAVGTLQNVYNNGVGPTSRILLDGVRNGIVIRDSAGGIGANLLSVQDLTGKNLLQVASSAWDLRTTGDIGLRSDAGNNAVRMTRSAGQDILPVSDGLGMLGSNGAALRWNAVSAFRLGSVAASVAPTTSPTFNANNGQVQRMIMTADLVSFNVSNFLPGQTMLIILEQDGTGGRVMTGNVAASVVLPNGAQRFDLSPEPAGITAILLVADVSVCMVLGVYHSQAHATMHAEVDLSTSVLFTYGWNLDPGYKHCTGNLPAATVVNLSHVAAHRGARYEFHLDGVITTAANKLTFQSNAVDKLVFDQNKTASGVVTAHWTGTAWAFSFAGTYA
jgi:hypothetical protein